MIDITVEDIKLQKLTHEYGIEGVVLALADVCEIQQEKCLTDFVDIKESQKWEYYSMRLHEIVKSTTV